MKIDRVFYINDDRDIHKRVSIETELNNFDIFSYDEDNGDNRLLFERFSTLCPESTQEIRMGKSHIAILELAEDRGYSNIIILEDDFRFVITKEEFYKSMENLSCVYLEVCLLAYKLKSGNRSSMYPMLTRAMRATDTTGYLITARYFKVLSDLFKRAVTNLERTNKPHLNRIGIEWYKLQLTDPWYCFHSPIGEQITSKIVKIENNSSQSM